MLCCALGTLAVAAGMAWARLRALACISLAIALALGGLALAAGLMQTDRLEGEEQPFRLLLERSLCRGVA